MGLSEKSGVGWACWEAYLHVATNAEGGSSGGALLIKDEDETGYNSSWDVQLVVVIGWQVPGNAQSLSDEGDTKQETHNTRR